MAIKELAVTSKNKILTAAEVKFLTARGIDYKTFLQCKRSLFIFPDDNKKAIETVRLIASKLQYPVIRLIRVVASGPGKKLQGVVPKQKTDIINYAIPAKSVLLPIDKPIKEISPFKTFAELPKVKEEIIEEVIKEKTYKLSGLSVWNFDDDD